jgi:hypothetical protein
VLANLEPKSLAQARRGLLEFSSRSAVADLIAPLLPVKQ